MKSLITSNLRFNSQDELRTIEQAKAFAFEQHAKNNRIYGIHDNYNDLKNISRILYLHDNTTKEYIAPAFLHNIISTTDT